MWRLLCCFSTKVCRLTVNSGTLCRTTVGCHEPPHRGELTSCGVKGAAAAQVVPHVHFHIIPRPALTPELRNRSFTMFGRGQRSELDEEEATVLMKDLKDGLVQEIERIQSKEKL